MLSSWRCRRVRIGTAEGARERLYRTPTTGHKLNNDLNLIHFLTAYYYSGYISGLMQILMRVCNIRRKAHVETGKGQGIIISTRCAAS